MIEKLLCRTEDTRVQCPTTILCTTNHGFYRGRGVEVRAEAEPVRLGVVILIAFGISPLSDDVDVSTRPNHVNSWITCIIVSISLLSLLNSFQIDYRPFYQIIGWIEIFAVKSPMNTVISADNELSFHFVQSKQLF